MSVTFEEAAKYLKDGVEVNLECDGCSYNIAPSEDWIGGEGQEGYISLALGNVIYYDAENILKKTIDFLQEDGHKVIISI